MTAMATIQVRNVPEAVHRRYQARAAAAGMSLQEYLLAEIVGNAALRAPEDLAAEVDSRMRTEGPEGFARVGTAEVVGTDRGSH